jgi:DNA-binding NtrC family response regulator
VDIQRRLAAVLEKRARREPGIRILASATSPALVEELLRFLDVIHIDVPSLRRRAEDIPLLAERFMRDSAREYARQPKRLGADALDALMAWGWPGNVRELRNLMERLLLFVETDGVGAADLPAPIAGGPAVPDLYGRFESLEAGLREFERYYRRRFEVP